MPEAKASVDCDSAMAPCEGLIVQMTEILASPESEGWRRRVLNSKEIRVNF